MPSARATLSLISYYYLRKTDNFVALPVALFEHAVYGVGLLALARRDVHYRLGHRLIEVIADVYCNLFNAERGENCVEALNYLVYARLGLFVGRALVGVSEVICNGQKF